MDNLEVKVEELSNKIEKLSQNMHNANERITDSLELLTANLKEVNEKVDKLGGVSNTNFSTMDEKLSKIFEELRKIGEYTRYEENSTLLDQFPMGKGKA